MLIVEDEEAQRRAVASRLTAAGLQVIQATNGEDGLEEALARHPDLVLLDIIMPRLDGVEVLRRLRRDSWGQTADVIMLTNLGDDSRGDEARALGATDYLVKTNWQLSQVIERVLERLK